MSGSKGSPKVSASCTVDRARGAEVTMRHIGRIDWEVIREGEVVQSGTCFNKLTDQGVAYMLNRTFFAESSQPFAAVTGQSNGGWYIGLIDSGPTLADTDTMASHAGWAELEAVYDQDAKEQYNTALTLNETRVSVGVDSTRAMANDSAIAISIDGGSPTAVGGVFLVNQSTGTPYSSSTAILFSTASFGTEPSVQSGDTLQLTYTHTMGASLDS